MISFSKLKYKSNEELYISNYVVVVCYNQKYLFLLGKALKCKNKAIMLVHNHLAKLIHIENGLYMKSLGPRNKYIKAYDHLKALNNKVQASINNL